jgi:hypothetical protein
LFIQFNNTAIQMCYSCSLQSEDIAKIVNLSIV